MRIEQISIDAVRVVDRVREDYGDIDALAASLKSCGQHMPIIVDEKYRLLAGGRRLQAAKRLGWTTINARVMDGLSPLQKLDIEVQENLMRKDFTEAEINKSIEMKKRLMRRPWYKRLLEFLAEIWESFLALFSRK